MSINLIDPNEEILKKQSWFVRGNADNNIRIPDFEEIRSFVELKMRPKVEGYYEVDENNVVNFKRSSSVGTIRLYGYHTRKNADESVDEYFSTRYTDELMGNNGKNKDYEGFGIKSIEVVYDANKIPVVTIVFYDLRGNVLSNFDSKFAQMFQLPYPIFELTLKGGFGPKVTYELLKTRDDISIDDNGNFIITSKFVGNKFSALADVPLLYLMAVPYLENKKVNVNDTDIQSFHELMINIKKLFTKVDSQIQSEQEKENITELEKKRDTLQSLINTVSLFRTKTKETIQTWFDDDADFKALAQPVKDRIQVNYIDATNQKSDVVYFVPQFSGPVATPINALGNLESTDIALINRIITTNVNTINIALKSQPPITRNLLIPDGNFFNVNGFQTDIRTKIDFSLAEKERQKLELDIITSSERYASNLENRLKNLITKYLGSTRLTVGSVFDIILNDYNKLLDKVYAIAEEAKIDTTRNKNNIRDSIPFPTVVKTDAVTGAQTIVFPGELDAFKQWPEVRFVNQFIDAFFWAIRNNYISEIVNEKNENGSSKYIPYNPREIYTKNEAVTIDNIYFNNTNTNNLARLIYQRFILLGNITIPLIDFSNTTYPAKASKWDFGNSDDTSFFKSIIGFFTSKDNVFTEEIAKNIFLSYIQFEARNIAHSIATEDNLKTWFKTLETQLNGSSENPTDANYYFTQYVNSEISTQKTPITDSVLDIRKADADYITITNVPPTPITDSSSEDIITKYIKDLSSKNNCTFTVDNVLFTKDDKLEENNKESDYDYDLENSVKKTFQKTNKIQKLYVDSYNIPGNQNSPGGTPVDATFYFTKLINGAKYLSLNQIPKGGLIILGALASVTLYPSGYEAKIIKGLNIIKNSTFEKQILNMWQEFSNNFHYKISKIPGQTDTYEITIDPAFANSIDYNLVLDEFYKPMYVSINDFRASPKNLNLSTSLTNTGFALNTIPDYVYLHYLKLLVKKINENVKINDKKVDDKFSAFESSLKDNDIKLSTYKTFQVIYESYLHKRQSGQHQLTLRDDFKFVDRAYNDISKRCVLDMKTMLNDINDSNVSILSAISRLLSDNNFWFYPFQGFLTTSENYNKLFDINYDVSTVTKPLFIGMYVGGLSSNPSTVRGYDITDDSIKEDNIPPDFGTGLNAFLVKYTGLQNQMVFSNFQHSTESLKNTDEGLRIQSDIINQANNSFAIPKGQSLLNVYQKQSYSSTIKIPYGNMGIQPTQYYYEKFIPIFEGLYIIYNVSHSIDSDTQRLETTFKGYRLKKDVNPIVDQELIDFIKNNAYRRIQSEIDVKEVDGEDVTKVRQGLPASRKFDSICDSTSCGKKSYYELKHHHSPTLLKKHKIVSAGDLIYKVAYRASGYLGNYSNESNYSVIKTRNENYDHMVIDLTLKSKNSAKVPFPAPFDGKAVLVDPKGNDGNPVMCLIDTTGTKTCVFLHWSGAFIKTGDTFKKGQRLAIQDTVGPTSSGIHLHIELMTLDDYIDYVNFLFSLKDTWNGQNVLTT